MDLLKVYEDYLTIEKKASANTVSSYMRDIQQFAGSMQLLEIIFEFIQKHIGG